MADGMAILVGLIGFPWLTPAATYEPSAHWIADRVITMPVKRAASYSSRVKGYIAFTDTSLPMAVAPDTMSDLTLVHPSKVSPSWQKLPSHPTKVKGVGEGHFSERVLVPV